jgi:hypothetical protein
VLDELIELGDRVGVVRWSRDDLSLSEPPKELTVRLKHDTLLPLSASPSFPIKLEEFAWTNAEHLA